MNAELHVIERGTGPPVVLLHGFPMDHTMWRFQCEALSDTYRVITPDLRGFGVSPIDSTAVQSGVSMADFADDVARLLDRLGIEEPVTLAGFSMGGYIAWQFVRRHRQRLRALVMCNTKAAADSPQAREIRFKMADGVVGWGSKHVAKLMTPKLFATTTIQENPKLVEELDSIIGRTNPVAIAAAQRGMAHRDDSEPLLATLDLPVLYVVGDEDQISPPAEMQAMADATPSAQLVRIPHSAHLSPMENPAAVTRAMRGFLDGLPV